MPKFKAILGKITTTVDGGWRVTFEVSQGDSGPMLQLASLRDSLFQISVETLGNSLVPQDASDFE